MTDTLDEVSAHAAVRWKQRAPDADACPRTAWREALPVPCEGLRGDEVRYHAETDCALVRKDTTLVTVVQVESGRPELKHACRHARGGRL
jgi:hypothetical protein